MRPQNVSRRYQALGALLLVALYLLPRLTNLDSIVTSDEPLWLGRSANFYTALWHGRLEDTFQFAHPGVTTMWAGMVGYWFAASDFPQRFTTNIEDVYQIHVFIRDLGLSEMDVLIAARVSKILLQAVLFSVALVYLRRHFGAAITAVAGIMIAIDPFLIANDRLLHVDGLFAIAAFAAVLALADAAISGHQRIRPWLVAGVLAAVAWLTRSTGIVLVGIIGIVLFVQAMADRDAQQPLIDRLLARVQPMLLWGGAALAATIILWPALWVDPISTFAFMVGWAANAVVEGHELPLYFMGQIYTEDPGILFYPVSILWRMTAIETIGIALLFLTLAGGLLHPRLRAGGLRVLGILALFAILYVVGMTIGAKKFDRYILPVYPVLNVFAAIGIITTLQVIRSWRPRLHPAVIPTMLAALLLTQAFTTLASRPYYLNAYNSLLGGADAAEGVMQMGWGESLSEAGDFIIADSGVQTGDIIDDPPVVRISGGVGPLIYALPLPYEVYRGEFQDEDDWLNTDYYVATIQQWQRDISGDVIGYLNDYDAVHTVHVEGVEYVRVYDLSEIPPPDWLTGSTSCHWRYQPNLQLENIVIKDEQATFWFQTLTAVALPDEVIVDARLVPRGDDTGDLEEEVRSGTFAPRQGRGWFTAVTIDLDLPEGTAFDQYALEITLTNATTGDVMQAVPPEDGQQREGERVAAPCGADTSG